MMFPVVVFDSFGDEQLHSDVDTPTGTEHMLTEHPGGIVFMVSVYILGGVFTCMVFVMVFEKPMSSVTTSVTVYVPSFRYLYVVVFVVMVCPSIVHLHDATGPCDVSVNVMISSGFGFVGEYEKPAVISPIVTFIHCVGFCRSMVSVDEPFMFE